MESETETEENTKKGIGNILIRYYPKEMATALDASGENNIYELCKKFVSEFKKNKPTLDIKLREIEFIEGYDSGSGNPAKQEIRLCRLVVPFYEIMRNYRSYFTDMQILKRYIENPQQEPTKRTAKGSFIPVMETDISPKEKRFRQKREKTQYNLIVPFNRLEVMKFMTQYVGEAVVNLKKVMYGIDKRHRNDESIKKTNPVYGRNILSFLNRLYGAVTIFLLEDEKLRKAVWHSERSG